MLALREPLIREERNAFDNYQTELEEYKHRAEIYMNVSIFQRNNRLIGRDESIFSAVSMENG